MVVVNVSLNLLNSYLLLGVCCGIMIGIEVGQILRILYERRVMRALALLDDNDYSMIVKALTRK